MGIWVVLKGTAIAGGQFEENSSEQTGGEMVPGVGSGSAKAALYHITAGVALSRTDIVLFLCGTGTEHGSATPGFG